MKKIILILALLLSAVSCRAAITETQHKVNRSTASATTVSVTMTSTAAGALIVVAADNASSRTVSSITDNLGTNTYVQASGAASSNGTDRGDIWYCLNANSGITSVTITFSGAAGTFNKEGFVFEVAGFVSATFDLAGAVNTQTANVVTVNGPSITTTSTIGFAVGLAVAANQIVAPNPQAGNEFTAGGDISAASNASASLISTTAAPHQPVWNDNTTSGTFCSSVAAFKELPASSRSHRKTLRMGG
jgi:hypothetical protein